MRKKIISTILLLALFAPAIVTYSWLQYRKHAVKREVKWRILNGVDKAELTALTFTKAQADQLNWKHSREFEFRGSMYDIVSTADNGATITYWCFNDHEEAHINAQISTLAEALYQSDPQKKDSQLRLIQFYKTLYSQNSDELIIAQNIPLVSSLDCYSKCELTGFAARFLRPPATCYHTL